MACCAQVGVRFPNVIFCSGKCRSYREHDGGYEKIRWAETSKYSEAFWDDLEVFLPLDQDSLLGVGV